MIHIDNIPSLRAPESCDFIFDDRIEKVKLINGNAVQDYGHVESGDAFAITCIFSAVSFESLKQLWIRRTKVTFTDEYGVVWSNMRLVLQRYRRVEKFPDYISVSFELWRI